MDITINYHHGQDLVGGFPLRELAAYVIDAEGKPADTEVSISFVDDDTIARMNAEYRGKEGPTDVLSFECDGLDDDFDAGVEEHPYELGDIVIATDVAVRQTDEFGTSLEEEVTLLVVHGLLHLCGYDHIEDDEAEVMEARERMLIAAWEARDEAR